MYYNYKKNKEIRYFKTDQVPELIHSLVEPATHCLHAVITVVLVVLWWAFSIVWCCGVVVVLFGCVVMFF